MIYIAVIVTILGLDQFSKWLVASHLAVGESLPVLGIFQITYVQNTGAAFSIFTGNTLFLILLTVVFLGILAVLWRKPFMRPYRFMAAIIVGGTLGNFLDRICRGFVVDMFDFTYFPVFNMADTALCCGVALLMLKIILTKDGIDDVKSDSHQG